MSKKTTHEIQNTDEELVFYYPKKGLKFAANREKVFIELQETQEYINECSDEMSPGSIIYDRDVFYCTGILHNPDWKAKKRNERTRAWINADSLRCWLRLHDSSVNYSTLSKMAYDRRKEWLLHP